MQLYLVSGQGSDYLAWEEELCFKDYDQDYEGLFTKKDEYITTDKATRVTEVCTADELKQALRAIAKEK